MNEDAWPTRRLDRADNSGNTYTEVTYIEDIVSKWLWRTVAPCLLLIGLTGNCYVVIIMFRVKFRKGIKLHLLILALTDVIILGSGLSRVWIDYTFSVDIRALSTASCRIHVYLQFTTMCYSAWILVSYSFERFVAMEFTIHAKSWCPIGQTRLRLCLAFIFLSLINVWVFWSFEVVRVGKVAVCVPLTRELTIFRDEIYVVIYTCFMSVLPFIILSTLNALLVCKLFRNCRLQQRLWTRLLHQRKGMPTKKAVVIEKRVQMKLLLATMFFLLTTLPSGVHAVVSSFLWSESEERLQACLYLSWTLTSLFQYANYALNFVFYTLGTVRREDLLRKTKLSNRSLPRVLSTSSLVSIDHGTRRGH